MKRARQISALALVSVLALTGCSGIGSDMGAVIEGTTYSVSDLQEAAAQLGQVAGASEGSGPGQVISDLSLLPVVEGIFAGTQMQQTEAQIRDLLVRNGLSNPTDTTLAAARSLQYQFLLQDPNTFADPRMSDALERAQSVTQDDIDAIQVEVNPRFGEWDASTISVVPQTPAWIEDASDG